MAVLETAPPETVDWDSLDTGKFQDEAEAVSALLAARPLSEADRKAVVIEAEALVLRGPRRAPNARAWSRASCRSSASRRRRAWR